MNDKAHDETTGFLPRYAKVFPHLATRLPTHILQEILDPRKEGVYDAAIIASIEDAGSVDLNIALFHAKSGGVLVLEDALAKLAEIIATDMMFVHVGNTHPELNLLASDQLLHLCQQRTDALIESCGLVPKRERPPSPINGWYIVELFGQHRYSAFVTEVLIANQPMFRLEIPTEATTPNQRFVKHVGPRAIYAMSPCDETFAMRISHKNAPMPVKAWELDDFPPRVDEAKRVDQEDGGEWETTNGGQDGSVVVPEPKSAADIDF
jgi:hypothetical protein